MKRSEIRKKLLNDIDGQRYDPVSSTKTPKIQFKVIEGEQTSKDIVLFLELLSSDSVTSSSHFFIDLNTGRLTTNRGPGSNSTRKYYRVNKISDLLKEHSFLIDELYKKDKYKPIIEKFIPQGINNGKFNLSTKTNKIRTTERKRGTAISGRRSKGATKCGHSSYQKTAIRI